MMIEDKYWQLISKKLLGTATPQELESLQQWVAENEAHEKAYEQATELWELAEPMSAKIQVDTKAAWAKVASQLTSPTLDKTTPKTGRIRKLVRYSTRIAAVLVVGWFSYWAYNFFDISDTPIVETVTVRSKGEQRKITLPDQSVVVLNANSTLEYDKMFENRVVELEGEAFFEVTHQNGNTFEVHTPQSKTRVLGTAFNVRAYAADSVVTVAVKEGKVAFWGRDSLAQQLDTVLLTAGTASEWHKMTKTLAPKQEIDANVMAWKDKQLIFKNAPLGKVLKRLETYFNIKITCTNPALLQCRFTGKFNDPKLKDVWEVLKFSLNISVQKTAKTNFTVSGKGC